MSNNRRKTRRFRCLRGRKNLDPGGLEYDTEHLKAAVNIPLEDLRERLDEVPKDRPVVVHCSVGYRSYVAQQILREHGWTNVRNLFGGFAAASGMEGLAEIEAAD